MREVYEKLAGKDGNPAVFEALGDWVLPWAKEHHPDKYAATLAVALKPKTFLAYLARLAEIRWEGEDKAGRLSAPLRALEETAIVGTLKTPAGREIVVKGRRAVRDGSEREWGWGELATYLDSACDGSIDQVLEVKEALDLCIADHPYVPEVGHVRDLPPEEPEEAPAKPEPEFIDPNQGSLL